MKPATIRYWLRAAALAALALLPALLPTSSSAADAAGNAERGAYILRLGGCVACHTDTKNKGAALAGGAAIKSPYGTFYAPNITPDPETGIGGWSTEDFIRAMTKGDPPEGLPYYPAFPYTSYTRMTRQDLIDLKAYLDTVPPVRRESPPHDLSFPYNIRAAMIPWQWLFFEDSSFEPDPTMSDTWNRGAYIVTGPGHCGECHSPRNFFGAIIEEQALSGTEGPAGKGFPGITQHPKRGIGNWTKTDITYMLKTGSLPDGDSVGGLMGEVVEHATSHWTDADREAVAEYLKSLPSR